MLENRKICKYANSMDGSLPEYVISIYPSLIKEWNDAQRLSPKWDEIVVDLNLNENNITYNLIKLCWSNHRVWHHEDPCRSGIPELIIQHKPLIDIHNQIRNDLIETIDNWVVWTIQHSMTTQSNQSVNTETVGSIIDRLSIMALKQYHTKKLADMGNQKAIDRVPYLEWQWQWLTRQFSMLINDVISGRRFIHVFRQYKMYNSPELNPLHKDNK